MKNMPTISMMTPSTLLQHGNTRTQASFILVFIFVVSYFLLFGAHRGKKSVPTANRPPPSPRRLPLIGNLHQLGSLPHRSLRSLAAAHGPVMLIRLGQVPAVVVSSASGAREVMQAQDHVFASRPSLTIPTRLLYGCTDIAFAPHGPYWRGARKMSVRHLLSPPRVRAYRAVREQEVEALVQRVIEQAYHGGGSGGSSVRLSELLNDFAKDVAGRIVLGLRAAGDNGWRAKVDAVLEESNVLLAAFHVGDYIPWLSWVRQVARSTSTNHGNNIVGEQDLAGMEYLRAVIKETMRLHTPGPLLLPHKSMQATRISSHGYDVPSDTMVIVNAWAIGRDPEAWESPEEFRPERFVGSGVDFRGQHFQLIPFGAGRRMCPGVNLAMSVVELALANLVARFDWALPGGEVELDMVETTGCTARKKAPLCAVATKRCFF